MVEAHRSSSRASSTTSTTGRRVRKVNWQKLMERGMMLRWLPCADFRYCRVFSTMLTAVITT